MKHYLSLALSCLLGMSANAQDQESLLWRITSPEGKESYLFGTYHLIGSEYLEQHKQVKQAFEVSSDVVVETEIDSSQLMSLGMMGVMQGKSLRDFYDSAEYKLVERALDEEMGIPLSQLDMMKPVAIAMMLTVSHAQDEMTELGMNYSGDFLDLHFAKQGRKGGKTIHTLESMQEQMDFIFNSESLESQAEMLLEMAEMGDSAAILTNNLLTYYRDQKLHAMLMEARNMEDTFGEMSMLVDKRNRNWIPKLKSLINRGEAFVAVGALHLPGEEGLINLLRKEGFTLEPIFF